MGELEIKIIQKQTEKVYGLWQMGTSRNVAGVISRLSQDYYHIMGVERKSIHPFYVVYRNYDKETGSMEIFVGSQHEKVGLMPLELEEGKYGMITIRPWLGFLWEPAIRKAKRYFYEEWAKQNEYEPANLEYELHAANSFGRKPSIDLLFEIRKNNCFT